jgi:hypothetical protein
MATIRCSYSVLLVISAFSVIARGQSVPKGSKVFIAQMENGLDGFIAPELIKKKIPIVVVTEESQADFVLSGASLKADDRWYNVVFGGKDKNEGNVRLLDVKTKQMVWAGEAGDRSLWWGSLRRGGERKVAERIVEEMKKQLFKK